MFEDRDASSSPSQNNEYDSSASAYLNRAAKACTSGDDELGLHLYLAAYEKGSEGDAPSEDAAFALRKAWVLAVKLKQRSLAEYIFEKLEPLLDPNELAVCAGQLQNLALEKLEEFGLSREDLQEMTDMISQDFLGMGPAHLMKVEHLTLPPSKKPASSAAPAAGDASSAAPTDVAEAASDAASTGSDADGDGAAAPSDAVASDASENIAETSAAAAADDASDASASNGDKTDDARDAGTEDEAQAASGAAGAKRPNAAVAALAIGAPGDQATIASLENITYNELAGYDHAIQTMRRFGFGMQGDEQFQGLVSLLNTRHGLDRMPAADSFLFRSPAREDAHRFMVATLGELGLPVIRMHMEENLQGAPVLCVMAQADNHPRLNAARNAFEGPGVLMLEDLDLWEAPVTDAGDDFSGFVYASLSRGAREAINLIRSAVDSPDVVVLASASDAAGIDGFFYDLLQPLTVVDIDYPDESERRDVWLDIQHGHPSTRGINLDDLVRLSAGMPRYDIYMAAREAIEDAYKMGLMQRHYVPVTTDNLFEKLAAYQPLDSEEYRALEDAVVRSFGAGLDGDIDDLLKG